MAADATRGSASLVPALWANSFVRTGLLFFVPFVVALVAYWPFLDDYFVLDDWIWMRESSDGSLWTVMRRAFSFPGDGEFSGPTPFFRPLADIALKVEYDVFGLNPVPFHVSGLVVHAAVAGLSGALVIRLTGKYWTGIAAAVLFAAAPAFDVAVVWIAQAAELLAALFAIASLHALLSFFQEQRAARARLYLAMAAAAFVLALLSKQSAVYVLAIAPMLAWAAPVVRRTRSELLLAALVGVTIAALFAAINAVDPASESTRTFRVERVAQYVGRLAWPFAGEGVRLVLGTAYASLGVFLIVTARRVPAFFFAWSIVTLVAFAVVPGPPQWRYTYPAAFPFFACLVIVLDDALRTVLAPLVESWIGGALVAGSVVVTLAWMPAARDGLTFQARQAEQHRLVEAALRDQCGDLPAGAVVYLVNPGTFDPFEIINRDLVNTMYDRVYVRIGEPTGEAPGDPVCVVRLEAGG